MNREVSFFYGRPSVAAQPVEVIERKGWGHPDTLSDALGETLSRKYAAYTLSKFGAVLHHQFDKVGIMGGRVEVSFGRGDIVSPIRVLLNGRASTRLGSEEIPVQELLIGWTREFFRERYPTINFDRHIRLLYEVNTGASPGLVRGGGEDNHLSHFFAPRTVEDLAERKALRCNDTSLGVGFAPPTPLEDLVLRLEQTINGIGYKADKPWLGNDIKTMACRTGMLVQLTMAVPQLAAEVPSAEAYRSNLERVRKDVLHYASEWHPEFRCQLDTNTRDNLKTRELYLTVTGSAMETGDEGFVGRGNRMGGLIAPYRPITMEGISGKNPVYHTGKMYCVAAFEIARSLYERTGMESDICLIGQRGRLLGDPCRTLVSTSATSANERAVREVIDEALTQFPAYTDKLLAGEYLLA